MPAAADCELIRAGFWGQPVNAASSLAFVLVGALLIRSRPVLAVTSCGLGVGSFVFHGPMPGWAEWGHDVTLAVLLVALILETRPLLVASATLVFAIGLGLFLDAADLANLVLAGIAGLVLARRYATDPTGSRRLAIVLLTAGGVLLTLSRTGGPLCQQESPLQGHGIWHLLSASALWLWARTARVSAHGPA